MNTKTIMSILLAVVLISACGGQTDTPQVQEPIVVEEQPAVEEAAPAEQTELAEPAEAQPADPVTASGVMPYTAPEGLFALEVPSGWSFSKDTKVIDNTVVETHTAPDGHAFVQVVVNEVGSEMNHVLKGQVTLDFMKRLYGSDLRVASDVTLPDGREKLEWWSDDNKTSGTTFFDTKDSHLFFYTTSYKDAYKKDYAAILEDVNNSFAEVTRLAVPADASDLIPYTAPEGLFTLEVPGGWSNAKDTDVIDNTVVETHTAPDGHAFVQVVVNEVGSEMNHVLKGQVTLDFMKRLYGSDLRVASDVTLPDGREKLEWWSDDNKTSGTTFFDTEDSYLFFYTTYYEDAYKKDYVTILEDVNNSYSNE